MFRTDNISVVRGGNVLLDHFSLSFESSQLCMVVGPNGAGKTTLLKCLDGEIVPDEGEVLFRDIAVKSWKTREIALCRGVLPQYSSLDFPFSVLDVVLMGRLPHASSSADNLKITREALSRCDCLHLESRAFPTLSGGEQQRVHTARVLAQVWHEGSEGGRFLLLDEPVSALDLSHQYALLELLKSVVRDQGLGVICTLHNLNLAAQFADRCLIIDQGRLVADGAPAEVFTEETLSNVFDLDIWLQSHPQNADIPLIIPKLWGG